MKYENIFPSMTNKQLMAYMDKYQKDKYGELGDLIREAGARLAMLEAKNRKFEEILGDDAK